MVRRLSFINSFNNIQKRNYNLRRQSAITVSINTLYYVNRPINFNFTTATPFNRQGWCRRRRKFKHLLYINLLGLWSTDYVFCRKLIKFNYNYCINKTSLIVHNLAALRGEPDAVAKYSEHVYLATLPKSIIYYLLAHNYKIFNYWKQVTGASLIISSQYINNPEDRLFKTCYISPNYLYSTSTIAPHSIKTLNNDNFIIDNLINTILWRYIQANVLELYKIHVLLTFYILNN